MIFLTLDGSLFWMLESDTNLSMGRFLDVVSCNIKRVRYTTGLAIQLYTQTRGDIYTRCSVRQFCAASVWATTSPVVFPELSLTKITLVAHR